MDRSSKHTPLPRSMSLSIFITLSPTCISGSSATPTYKNCWWPESFDFASDMRDPDYHLVPGAQVADPGTGGLAGRMHKHLRGQDAGSDIHDRHLVYPGF